MGELSPEQAAVGIYKDYITTPPSYADRKAVGLGKQQYAAITKPAALTGELDVSSVTRNILEKRDGEVVRALSSHQCDPGLIPRLSITSGLSLLLVL